MSNYILNNKTLSRLAAIQTVYLFDISKNQAPNEIHNIESNIIDIITHYTNNKDSNGKIIEIDEDNKVTGKINKKFVNDISISVYENISDIDIVILKHLTKQNEIDKLNFLLRAILRCAVCELHYFQTPYKVVIDEYVKLTKDFFGEAEVNFVNAILDKIAKEKDERI